jgi:2'-5' RNA ligase
VSRRTAVVVPVPEAEPVVGRWRERYDPSAAAGMPAHVTALFPFVEVDDAVVATLRSLCAALPPLDVEFRRCARFPGAVLYLDPEPAAGLRRLTEAIAARWPEAPPYEGRFADVVPHLTVASGVDDAVADEIEAELSTRLPIRARLDAARVYEFDGARWRCIAALPFRGRTAAG